MNDKTIEPLKTYSFFQKVAFTIKELREMINLPEVSHKIHLDDRKFLETCLQSKIYKKSGLKFLITNT